jgi:hypothetical protein
MQVLENPMIKSEEKVPYMTKREPIQHICGCGKEAEYLVYLDKPQEHCEECMFEAIDSKSFVGVRTI